MKYEVSRFLSKYRIKVGKRYVIGKFSSQEEFSRALEADPAQTSRIFSGKSRCPDWFLKSVCQILKPPETVRVKLWEAWRRDQGL